MKDEGHGLYPLIGYSCHIRSTGLRAYWCGCVHYLGGVSIVTLELEGGAGELCILKVLFIYNCDEMKVYSVLQLFPSPYKS